MVSSRSNEDEIFAGNSGSRDKSSGRKGHVILEHTPRISVKYYQNVSQTEGNLFTILKSIMLGKIMFWKELFAL